MIGDKAFGLLMADRLGAHVPRTLVVARRIAPFTFGRETGSTEIWTRTCPVEPHPGLYTTLKGWTDPFALLQAEDPEGRVLASATSLANGSFGAIDCRAGMAGMGATLPIPTVEPELLDVKVEEFSALLHLRPLCEGERVLYVDAEVAHSAFDFRMAEQDLHRAQTARLLIDDGRLASAQRMGPVILRTQSDPRHPLINKSSILPSADMIGVRRSGALRLLPI
jgi:hypothetical protein